MIMALALSYQNKYGELEINMIYNDSKNQSNRINFRVNNGGREEQNGKPEALV